MNKNLQMLRLASGLKQEDVARKIGVTRELYARVETGQRGLDAERIADLCELFKCSPLDLGVRLAKTRGGQAARPHNEVAAAFGAAPVRIQRPTRTSTYWLPKLREDLRYWFQPLEPRLPAWEPWLDEAPSESRNETLNQVRALSDGALTTEASTNWMGFDAWPVCDTEERGAGHYLRPALVTPEWMAVFQVEVVTRQGRYRMDMLIRVLLPWPTFVLGEVDGFGRESVYDQKRQKAIGLPTIRIPSDEIMKGPSIADRLRSQGLCLPPDL